MLRISEVVRGASVNLNRRLTGCSRASQWVRGFCAVVGMVLPHSHGDLGLSLRILLQGEAQAWRGWIFLMKELPCGYIFTLQDITTTQLSTDIDKAKCHFEALYSVKIGCGSSHLSYCSKTAYLIRKNKLLRNTLHARHVNKFSRDMKPNTIYNVSYLISKGRNQNNILVYC